VAAATLIDPAVAALPSGRRAEVLGRLRDAGHPLSVGGVAELTGLHVNTARFHLDGLVEDGLAERRAEERDVPGRPKILYTAPGETPGPRSYRLLAEMLTGLVASLRNAGPVAQEVGRSWGRHLIERAAPSQRVDAGEAVDRLTRLLDGIGFAPEVAAGRSGREAELRLHHCPFLDVAQQHTDVVCAIHLGLMQGALAELDAPVQAVALEPFVTPNLCLARLRTHGRGRP